MYVAIDKFTKWPEVEAVRKVTAQSAVKFFKGLVCRFGVPNRVITNNDTQFTSHTFMQLMTHKYRGSIVVLWVSKSVEPNEEQKGTVPEMRSTEIGGVR